MFETTTYTESEILEHRRQWVEALRSGEYEQGQGVLVQGHPEHYKYCCLGVACALTNQPINPDSRGDRAEGYYLRVGDPKGSTSLFILPYEVMKWLGLHVNAPAIDYADSDDLSGQRLLGLTDMNDRWGFTFNQIADMIEYFGFYPQHDALQTVALTVDDGGF